MLTGPLLPAPEQVPGFLSCCLGGEGTDVIVPTTPAHHSRWGRLRQLMIGSRIPPARIPAIMPTVLAAELLGRVRAELSVIGGLREREQVLVSAWLTGLRVGAPGAPMSARS